MTLNKLEVQDIFSAREFLKKNNSAPTELINAQGTMRCYGILVLNHMFTLLKQEFDNIKTINYDFEGDKAAYDTARKLNII